MATAYIIWDRKDKAQVGGPGATYAASADASAAIREKISRQGRHAEIENKTFDVVAVTV